MGCPTRDGVMPMAVADVLVATLPSLAAVDVLNVAHGSALGMADGDAAKREWSRWAKRAAPTVDTRTPDPEEPDDGAAE